MINNICFTFQVWFSSRTEEERHRNFQSCSKDFYFSQLQKEKEFFHQYENNKLRFNVLLTLFNTIFFSFNKFAEKIQCLRNWKQIIRGRSQMTSHLLH